MAEFKVGEHLYSARKMDAFTALHVGLKMLPAVAPFMLAIRPASAALAAARTGSLDESTMGDTLVALDPLARVVSELPEASVDYIVKTCLGVVSRSVGKGGGWSPVWNDQAGRLMFDDIQMFDMLAIVANVIRENHSAFFPGNSSLSSGAEKA